MRSFYIVLGCFLDGISMIVLTMGVDPADGRESRHRPLWFGIFIVLVVEMAQITPPVGFNLFVLQGMTGKTDHLDRARTRCRCSACWSSRVLLIWFVPGARDWLPQQMKLG